MTKYAVLNCFLFGVAGVAVLLCVRSRRQAVAVFRTATTITLLAFPWDHFAIRFGAWAHPDPGPQLFGVPLNDLAMCFACTLFSASMLNHSFDGDARREAEAERERGA